MGCGTLHMERTMGKVATPGREVRGLQGVTGTHSDPRGASKGDRLAILVTLERTCESL